MTTNFFIPCSESRDNKITTNDIENGKLRITAENKKYFPSEDCEIILVVSGREWMCKLSTKSEGKNRSHRLWIGQELMNELQVSPNSILEFNRVSNATYKVEK